VITSAVLNVRFRRIEHAIDFLGAALVTGSATSLLLVTVWGGGQYDWTSPMIVGVAVAGVALLGLFVVQEGRALRAWLHGDCELVVSRLLLEELERALSYPKLRKLISPEDAAGALAFLASGGTMSVDPDAPPGIRARDAGDDYLIALAEAEGAFLVSGDKHLLELASDIPVYSPSGFLELLRGRPK
jgi:putative PIN family toxin of toxin-antitoxin system